MHIEVELKFPVADVAELEQRLAALQPVSREFLVHVDCYFNHPCRDFARTDEALRLRREGANNMVTFKGPKLDATTKTRREIEIVLAPGDRCATDAATLFESLGFSRVAEVHKRRQHLIVRWEGRAVSVALDDVAGLGSFVELELIAQERELGQVRDCLASLAARLGLTNSERRSYLELLVERQT